MTPETTSFTELVAQGPIAVAFATLVSGFLVSLTPCVYPMIAVTVSIFGARESTSRRQSALLSAVFVLGIVCMFAPLGVVAAMTGKAFGSVLSNAWVVVGISSLFLLMAASMFGAFDLDLPTGLKNKLATVGGGGLPGAFVLGLVCGPIAAPCTGPFLTGILAWIAQTQSAPLGALVMATFALGLGIPFFFVGTFAMQLPKSGRWMIHVKSILGIVLCVVALYFLTSAFPVLGKLGVTTVGWMSAAAAAAVLGVVLGAVHRSFESGTGFERGAKGVGLLLTVGGAFALLQGQLKAESALTWQVDKSGAVGTVAALEVAREQAKAEGRPLLVDFTAAWCAACKELEKLTFADAAVQAEAGRFIAAKVDATDDEVAGVEDTMQQFKVAGLPTVVLFDSTGAEVRRFTDFVPAVQFLEALKETR
ncbi:MAG: hypothetical protein RJA70_2078 [Pseudomonadota bacterium]|jgi:thiol:disulfide interchange protein DsbD